MARLSLSLPEDLAIRIATERPGLNISALLQSALRGVLDDCAHDRWLCASCTAPIERRQVEDAAAGQLYRAAMVAIGDLVAVCGTAEGAARLLRREGQKLGVELAFATPLPKPTRAEREAARDRIIPLPPRSVTVEIGMKVIGSMDEISDQPNVTFEPDGTVILDPDGSGRIALDFYSDRHFGRWVASLAHVVIRRNGGFPIIEAVPTEAEPVVCLDADCDCGLIHEDDHARAAVA